MQRTEAKTRRNLGQIYKEHNDVVPWDYELLGRAISAFLETDEAENAARDASNNGYSRVGIDMLSCEDVYENDRIVGRNICIFVVDDRKKREIEKYFRERDEGKTLVTYPEAREDRSINLEKHLKKIAGEHGLVDIELCAYPDHDIFFQENKKFRYTLILVFE